MSVGIRRLEASDDRDRFCSGHPDLDRFFQRFAGQNQFRHHVGVTYIAVEDDAILGFVTVSPSEIEIDALPADRRRRLPRYPLPTLRLARLAVAQSAQGRGIGQALLRFALTLARRMADEIGCVGVVVDAKPEAQTFYLRYGFESVSAVEGVLLDRPEPTPMFLPLSAIPCPDNR
ncbi:GNAT family N-acetyltransferase [Thiocapsa roseopersicina]|uniref:Acetyltransferase (GNAT) domain-containing protein n=1 Tax=Thiocapsa roseopersicina TaxID=1058 RepID=A0A1H3D1W9_THIRO|nr:GNAT family N-acetyltransferase [Thiocapsa roseopersicina]SDX60397.1 Acetyltransferase (GNAT) domain-containing protein [Thiocapsa roseopersicina]